MAKLNIRNRNKDKIGKDGKPRAANWEYRFEAAKVDGKRKHISKSGFRTKREAEVAGAKALSEYENSGVRFEASDMSYSDYLDFWFESYVKVSCKYTTQRDYDQIIETYLKPSLGMYKLKSLSPMTIQEFVNKTYLRNLKKTTITNIICVVTSSLKYAVLPANLLQASPAQYIKYPKVAAKKSEINRTVISVQDFNRILDRFDYKSPYRYSILIGFYTGLRIGETYALTWDDIDLENGYIDVNKLVYKRNFGEDIRDVRRLKGKKEEKSGWYFGETKTHASVRKIKIGSQLISELKIYKEMQLKNQEDYGNYYTRIYKQPEIDEKGNTIHRLIEVEASIPVKLPEANLIMRKENGEYSSTDTFKVASRVIHHELEIQFNYHSLRHTHATMLIESGISPKTVQERLGHENIQTTLQTYVHNTKAMEDHAVEVFDKILSTK